MRVICFIGQRNPHPDVAYLGMKAVAGMPYHGR